MGSLVVTFEVNQITAQVEPGERIAWIGRGSSLGLVECALAVGICIPIGPEQGLEFAFIFGEVDHYVQIVERFPFGFELLVGDGSIRAVIGILNGKGLAGIIVACQEQIMRCPQVVIGTEGVVRIKISDALNDNRIPRRQQFFKCGQITCHTVLDVKPACEVAHVIGQLFGINVAVL